MRSKLPGQGAIDRPFLGEAAIRIARLLGVTGAVSPAFERQETIIPVVMLGDATLPGYGGQSQRRFGASHQTTAGAGIMSTVVVASQDVILYAVQFLTATVGTYTLTVGAGAPPSAAATADVFFTDRLGGTGAEIAPLLTGNGDGVALTGSLIWRGNPTAINVPQNMLLAPICLAAGNWLQVRGAGVAVTHSVNLLGMTL